MKSVSGKELCKVFERNGWSLLRVHGSHHIHGGRGTLYASQCPCMAPNR